MLPQDTINQAFKEIYANPRVTRDFVFTTFTYSGYALLNKIDPQEKVLDVGCGNNLFKKHLPNLIGIDPVTDEADYKVALLDYTTEEKFDVMLCLSSVQFGELADIKESIAHMSSMLRSGGRIYWRCSMNSDTSWRFEWTELLHETLPTEFGFTLADMQKDYLGENQPGVYRIYAEWIKS